MSHPLRRVLVFLAVGALAITSLSADTGRRRATGPTTGAPAPEKKFVPTDLEYYLTDDGVAYIRPGLNIKVNSITIGSDRKPVVELTLTDNMNQPLDRLGQVTPGPISLSYILAYWDPETREYTAYTTRNATPVAGSPRAGSPAVVQAGTDSGGQTVDLSTGKVKYTFAKVLPESFDRTKTHTLGIYATRNLNDFILNKRYYANVEHDFRPDGGTVTAKWDKIRDAASCLNCHDPLALHGGSRRDVKLCVMCHSTQTSDPETGNSVNMAEMTHRIHAPGRQKTPYIIWGNQSSIHNYSHVTYPQDVRNCDNCHVGTNTANVPAQADVYLTRPSRRACGACHNDVNFATGEGHGPGVPAQTDDSQCNRCHIPDSGQEFDASIVGAHTIPEKSKQLKGLTSTIVSVSNVAAGQKPTIVFSIKNADGSAVDGTKLATFAPILAGPTSSYEKYFREDARTRATFDAATGQTTYTFTNAIPEGSTGTWAFSADIYRSVVLKNPDGSDYGPAIREAAYNPLKYAAVTGAVAARRVVTPTANCNKCHDRLALHGGQRLEVQECVICHNPKESDVSRRPANAGQPESISMQRMIHRIHTGEELTQDLTIYGFGNTPHNYNEVLYPGDRRNCASCHAANTHQVPPPPGAGAVTTLRDYFSPQGPGTASCLGCHDSQDAAAHAYLNTTMFPNSTNPAESCGVCHGTNAEWAVDKVHAR
jgi:OmcA/MtrC family decaheme c-type cytochrome